MLDLAGCWTLSDESGAHVLPFDLPGDASRLWSRRGDPRALLGPERVRVRWVSERDWWRGGCSAMTAAPPSWWSKGWIP